MTELTKKLTSARFWITIMLSLTFCYITLLGKITAEQFVIIYIVLVNHYYKDKKRKEDEKDNSNASNLN